MTTKEKIETLISKINTKTNVQDVTLSEGINRLIEGYNSGGSASESSIYEGSQLVLNFENTKEAIVINENKLYIGTAVSEVPV